MPIPGKDDDDEFRAMGYVAVYAAHVEEMITACFRQLAPFDPNPPENAPWQVSKQVSACMRALRALPPHEAWRPLLALCEDAKLILADRNLAIHSPLYSLPAGGNVRRAREVEDDDKFIVAHQIYELAEELFHLRDEFLTASVKLNRWLREAHRDDDRNRVVNDRPPLPD